MRRRDRIGTAALVVALGAGPLLLPGVAAAHAGRAAQPQTLARIELTDMSPRIVTTASEPMLRVSGRVVNIGDRSIIKLGVRLQRDEPVRTDQAVTAAIRGVPEAPHVTRFRPVQGDLAPGQSSPFQLAVPLRGGGDLESLQINEPGVYPLLVNLNGKPDYGGTARLASVPLLLPVLGVPPAAPPGIAAQQPGAVLSRPPAPTPITVVWPLAADPARLPTGPGEPTTIAANRDGRDPMAVQLAPGGRLDGLVGALEQVVPPGSPLAAAVCVAVDPLLLETVDGMSRGYQVAHSGTTSPGTGAKDAQAWLDRLRSVVQGRCVLPLPYADPDLVALSRAGLTDLEALATSTGVREVRDLLGVKPLTGIVWPAGGVLDERTLADLTALQTRAVLLDPRGVTPPPPTGDVVGLAAGASGAGGSPTTGMLLDPLLTGALDPAAIVEQAAAAPDGTPSDGSPSDSAEHNAENNVAAEDTMVAARPTDTPGPLATQDGLGALIYRAAVDPDREPILLAPPRRWQARGQEATQLLRTARTLLETGFLAPRELAGLAEARPPGPTASAGYPPQSTATEVPADVAEDVQQARDVLRDLQVATVRDATANLEPADLLDPLRLGLLRAMSSAWGAQPGRAEQVMSEERARLDELRGAVRIVQPPGPYTLAASDSPLLITVNNELPVGVQVRLTLSETPGLRAGAVGLQLVPARSTRQFLIPAEVSRAGQFSVGARLSTPSGTALGQPSTLQLRSTAFGTVTIALTAGAGAVLILLVTRRIVRRVRSARKGD
ncbi:MAG: DUF6049 family protein [Pseudonocardiaceae bacterium]